MPVFSASMLRRGLTCVAAIMLLTVATVPNAWAKSPRPFGGVVVAQWDNVFAALPIPAGAGIASFQGRSQMLHMGRSAQAGTLSLGFPNAMGIASGTGSVTITAANGDSVSFDYTGSLNAVTGQGSGPFVITGGTGRFAGATGGGTFCALIDVTSLTSQAMNVVLTGRIVY